jgi:hypothetical protein
MDLEGDQIVGFDKYPVSHRGMASGARPAPSGSSSKSNARAELRNTILEAAVVNASPCTALAQPGCAAGCGAGAPGRFPAIHGGAGGGRCFVNVMETVSDTPTRRDTFGAPACCQTTKHQ